MRAGGFAADDERVRAEFGFGVSRDPQRRRLAVVRPGGIGMFGRETVIHADDRDFAFSGDLFIARVLQMGASQNPPAAVNVQIDALRTLRDERAQSQRAAGAVNDALFRHIGQDNRPGGAPPFLAGEAGLFDWDFGYGRRFSERRLQLDVEIGGFAVNGVGGEQRMVYHARASSLLILA